MDIVLRTAFMYFFILIVLRVTTRRILRSATPLDLVVIFLFGGLAMPSVLSNDMSMTAAILGMATVAGIHFSLSRMRTRWPVIGMLTEGTSVVIYAKDGFDENQMLRSRITMQDVEAEMRQSGATRLDQIHSIVVEHNGGITVMTK
jgi:uncharacterized membrane protein YcaP (DUF421 family)